MNSWVVKAVSKINAVLLWGAVQRKMPVIAGMMVAAGMAAYFILSIMTPEFSAVSKVSVTKPGDKSYIMGTVDKERQLQSFYHADFLDNVIQTLNLQTHPEFVTVETKLQDLQKEVSNRLTVRNLDNTNILFIRFRSTDPNLASEAANAFANAYLVQTSEKQNGLKVQLLARAVPPISADYPKKGPIALFVMSLMGLTLLGYILLKEHLRTGNTDEEDKLDEKHHELDMGHRDVDRRQAPIISKRKSGPVFRGVYPWQPEEALEEIVEQLRSLRKTDTHFSVLVAAENPDTSVIEEGLEVARSFAKDDKPTLLVDIGSNEHGLSYILDLQNALGLTDVVRDTSVLGSVIQVDAETSLHMVSSGTGLKTDFDDNEIKNLMKVFGAWSTVYEVVIVCCSYHLLEGLHDVLGNEFEAGVFIQNGSTARQDAMSRIFAAKAEKMDLIYFRQRKNSSSSDNIISMSAGSA